MPEYQLQIKQVVDYPRCRIYREFIHKLINDRRLRPLRAVTRYRMPDTEKAGRSWVYLYHVVSRPAWKRDLPAELPVHHV